MIVSNFIPMLPVMATVTAKGQTTIPIDIRRQLGLKPGDKVEFFLDGNGQAVMKPSRKIHVSELYGILKPKKGKKPISLEEIDRVIRTRAVERVERARD